MSQSGHRVTAYFSDGREPITYDSEVELRHAEVGRDGTLWLTTAGGHTPNQDTTLLNVDPATGEVLSTTRASGFASMSPDGSRMAFARVPTEHEAGAVVIRNAEASDPERVTQGQDDVESALWALGEIHWSPDGTGLLVKEYWEDDSLWLIDLAADPHVNDGIALTVAGADWLSNDRLLATAYCYAEPETTPRHLVEVDLTTPEPTIIDRDERSGALVGVVPSGGLDTAVHLVSDTFDTSGTLVRPGTGDVIAEDVVSVQW